MEPKGPSRTRSPWAFDPSTRTSQVGHCANCYQSVIVLNARIVGVAGNRYFLEGRCKQCGETVPFSI
jgi:hypothetical protein